ncbi:MAG: DUF983 domain-containing protein [Pseudomonadota bacterium]
MADVQQVFGNLDADPNKRGRRMAMFRGWRGKCPNCGEGKLFQGYLASTETCAPCGEELYHHRADDFPAYLVIFIIGHTLIPAFLAAYFFIDMGPWAQVALWLPLTIVATLYLLPRVKGAVIGLQWALRMHGFGGRDEDTYEL